MTTFGCIWVAVHPNFLDTEEKSFETALQCLRLMVMALIVPVACCL